jgi:hypothetical protein
MASYTPPYGRKFDRAERHIEALEAIVAAFVERHPYEVRQTVVDGGEVNSFHFTDDPDPDIPLIVGDILFNLRSGFDHVIAALVKPAHRRNVLFPILHQPVWDIPHQVGENTVLTKERERWDGLVKRLAHPEAIDVLKAVQPLDSRAQPPMMHPLDVLNWLSNVDKHRQLSVVLTGLDKARSRLVMRGSGRIVDAEQIIPESSKARSPFTGIGNGALLPTDPSVKYVKLRGEAVVVVVINQERGNIRVPKELRMILDWLRSEVLAPLTPYVHSA